MKADYVDRGAGVQFGDRFISAATIDYSSKGARLVLLDDIDISVGDELRVAISQGQYKGVIRRLAVAADGRKVVGVEFLQLIPSKAKFQNSPFLGNATVCQSVGGNFAAALIGGFFIFVASAVFAYFYFLVN